MKTFKTWLDEGHEKRFASEHEPLLRKLASDARQKHYGKPKQRSQFGDCDYMSGAVEKALKAKYPSAKATSVHGGSHSIVAVPEIDHYVDATNDQDGKKIGFVSGRRLNHHAIKIGKWSDYSGRGK